VNVAAAAAQHLLIELRFDGTPPSYLARKDGAPYQRAVDLLHTLDSYSNGALCPLARTQRSLPPPSPA